MYVHIFMCNAEISTSVIGRTKNCWLQIWQRIASVVFLKITRLRLAPIAMCMQNILSMNSMHCIICIVFVALYSLHCIICILLYALYTMHNIICIASSALYSMHYMLCIVLYTSMHCFLCIVFYA